MRVEEVVSPLQPALELPPLENGDRLTRLEFERRYRAMPQVKKAELIEGLVFMSSPVRHRKHGQPHACIMGWLGTYFAATPGIDISDNATVRLDSDNEVQPDALLRIEVGGQSHISDDDDYIEGAPELIVEIAESSASYDLHEKLKVYRRNQVQEYLVWQVYDRAFDWFRLREGKYDRLQPDEMGIVRSEVFPGLWLAVTSLLEGDLARVLAMVTEGVAGAAHEEFLQSLQSA
ncbi:Uma2 family endonuclease [Oscillatoriales cyanobacterium LEGE 11467]|uniref:Uma2 family endonuclease n=1 Tax=Zarconia navalis LEGE 11467 TaxID=1828826 RepID=A0A928VYP9_9CYAN|nr:Uma2 family endonuclease [Zarconia navalis]MBE9040726.1 Uma2 family endonuclease [Zarconia navalis LEGE 11467]